MYGRAQMCSSVTVELRTTAQKVLAEALPVSPQPPGEGVIFPQVWESMCEGAIGLQENGSFARG